MLELSDELVWYYVDEIENTNWFEENTSESRLAKYWVSEEIAGEMWDRDDMLEYDIDFDYLVQLLKKEWFR